MYHLLWDKKALDDLKKLGADEARRVARLLASYKVKDPLASGTPVDGGFANLYRYRISDYGVVVEVKQADMQMIIVRIRCNNA